MDESWSEAREKEFWKVDKNKTLKIVLRLEDEEIINTRWVFTQKNIEGQTIKKALLIAIIFMQTELLEEEVYTPVVKMVSIWLLLSSTV